MIQVTANNVHESLSNHILTDGLSIVIDFERSKGSWLVCKKTGQKYLDCFGQFASLSIGYNHPIFVNHTDKLTEAAKCKIVNSDLYSCEYASFVETLFEKALPNYFKYAFFIEGGSPAVENCLKVAFDWKAKRMGFSDKQAQIMDVIHLKEAFHGRGGYTMSLTNTGPLKTELFPRFPWTRISNPKIHFPLNIMEIKLAEEQSLEQAENALKTGTVAAIIMEPVQSEGGNNMFRQDYFKAIRALADQYNALLIFDEVQTGFGASGEWWCHQNYDVKPDLMAFGKKSQVCGIAGNPDRLDTVEDHCFKASGRINSTWGGSLVDMVRSQIIIDIIEKENLVEQAKTVGNHILVKLRELEAVSAYISNTRGIGTLIAFDLPDGTMRDSVLAKLQREMLILGCGERSIRFRPALTFSKEDADTALDILKKTLR